MGYGTERHPHRQNPPPWHRDKVKRAQDPGNPGPPAGTNKWLILEYAHSWLNFTLYVACTTDVPCHMFLRWTDKEEHIHLHSKDVRGETFLGDPKYCFVEWNEVEQNEPGDTLSHTFHFSGWFVCARRWWMFRATIAAAESPSTTGIFSAHYLDQEEAESLKHTDLVEKEVAGVIDHADASIKPAKLDHPFAFPQFPFTPGAAPTFAYQVANKKYVDDKPTGSLFGSDDTNPVVYSAADVWSFSGWQDLALDVWVPPNTKAVFFSLYMRLISHVGSEYWAWFGVRKDGTTPTWYQRLFFNENSVIDKYALLFGTVICPLALGRNFEWAYSTSEGADKCNIDVKIILLGWLG